MGISCIIWVKSLCYKWQKSIQTGSYNVKAQHWVCRQVWLNPHIQTRPAEFGCPFLCLYSWLNSPLFVMKRPETLGLIKRESCSFPMCVCVLRRFSRARLFVTLWTMAHQASLSVGSSRQEYWSWLPFPPTGDLSKPGIEPVSLASPALAGGFFTTSAT